MKVEIHQSCLICKHLQVVEVFGRTLDNKGYYTCGAEKPVYGSVKLNSECNSFELNQDIMRDV